MHQLSYLVNCSMMFTEVPALERPAAARAAGFDAIEFWWPFPTSSPSSTAVELFVRSVRDAGVQLVGLNFAAGDMPAGDRGLVSWPGREEEFRDSVETAVSIGEQLGTVAFNALYGNRLEGHSAREQDELAVANLAGAARAAARIGADVLLEPVSGAPRYPLLTAADVAAVIDRVEAEHGTGNLAMLADLYHLFVNGDDVEAALVEHRDRIGHVQVADAPGRHQPGTGSLDLDAHLSALEAGGYTGWVGLEYAPTGGDTLGSLGWLDVARRSARTPVPAHPSSSVPDPRGPHQGDS